MNLRNFRIGTRLGVGFAIILGGLIVVLLLANTMSANNRKAMVDGLNLASQKQVLANNMKSALFEGGIAMRNIGIQSDVAEMQKEEGKVKLQRKRYEDAKEKIFSLGLSEEEKTILGDIAKIDKEIEKPFK
ncbi:MAG: methyl-accepting chemotaxis protein, partial [Burkholderiales bacterium]|nr:methyl-accepting chemotaxis protein [Burkholderiales bacterium]